VCASSTLWHRVLDVVVHLHLHHRRA
jgi:hypothetical protein